MPKFFFHTQAVQRMTDEVGSDLIDLATARREAIRTAGELLRDGADTFWGTRPWLVTVTDDAGKVLLEIQTHGQATAVAE